MSRTPSPARLAQGHVMHSSSRHNHVTATPTGPVIQQQSSLLRSALHAPTYYFPLPTTSTQPAGYVTPNTVRSSPITHSADTFHILQGHGLVNILNRGTQINTAALFDPIRNTTNVALPVTPDMSHVTLRVNNAPVQARRAEANLTFLVPPPAEVKITRKHASPVTVRNELEAKRDSHRDGSSARRVPRHTPASQNIKEEVDTGGKTWNVEDVRMVNSVQNALPVAVLLQNSFQNSFQSSILSRFLNNSSHSTAGNSLLNSTYHPDSEALYGDTSRPNVHSGSTDQTLYRPPSGGSEPAAYRPPSRDCPRAAPFRPPSRDSQRTTVQDYLACARVLGLSEQDYQYSDPGNQLMNQSLNDPGNQSMNQSLHDRLQLSTLSSASPSTSAPQRSPSTGSDRQSVYSISTLLGFCPDTSSQPSESTQVSPSTQGAPVAQPTTCVSVQTVTEVDRVSSEGRPSLFPKIDRVSGEGRPSLLPKVEAVNGEEGDTMLSDCGGDTSLDHRSTVGIHCDSVGFRENPFNMRVSTLRNFGNGQQSYRALNRAHSLAIHKAKAGSINNQARSLDLLRQNLQKYISNEIKDVIEKYIQRYFKPCVDNMQKEDGTPTELDRSSWDALCVQILEETKKMYCGDEAPPPQYLPVQPVLEHRDVRAIKHSLFKIKKRRPSDDSNASSTKIKKGRPSSVISSGRSTPSKRSIAEGVRKEGPRWDPTRLTTETEFCLGSKANTALGLGSMRGRLYVKHPELFKYIGDQEDKLWLYENRHMPTTGGKAYLLVYEDIVNLAQTNDYRDAPGVHVDTVGSFTAPQFMIDKMQSQMSVQRTRESSLLPSRVLDITPVDSPQNDDVDDDANSSSLLPFSTFIADSRIDSDATQPSPCTTDMDLQSVGGASPFHTTGGFSSFSPSVHPDLLDDAEDSMMVANYEVL